MDSGIFDFLMDLFLDWDSIEDYSHLAPDTPETLDKSLIKYPTYSAAPGGMEHFWIIMNRITTPEVEWDGTGVRPGKPSSGPSGYSSYEEYEYEMWKQEQVGGGYTDETLPLDYSPMS